MKLGCIDWIVWLDTTAQRTLMRAAASRPHMSAILARVRDDNTTHHGSHQMPRLPPLAQSAAVKRQRTGIPLPIAHRQRFAPALVICIGAPENEAKPPRRPYLGVSADSECSHSCGVPPGDSFASEMIRRFGGFAGTRVGAELVRSLLLLPFISETGSRRHSAS